MRRLPRVVGALLSRLPDVWRDSIEGDLHEEVDRRRATGRSARPLWMILVVLDLAWRLRRTHTPWREQPRHARASWLASWAADIAHAGRRLRRQPAYCAVAVLTGAVGIGAATTVFALANWVLLRPLPGLADPHALVSIGFGSREGSRGPINYPDVVAMKSGVPALDDLAAFTGAALHVARPGRPPERVAAEVVTANYFGLLGPVIAQGRGFDADPDQGRGGATVVLSHRLWQRLFGGEGGPGETVAINGLPHAVAGIAVRGFHGASRTGSADVWMPIGQHRVALPVYTGDVLTDRRNRPFFTMIGRLAPGAQVSEAAAQAEVVRAQLARAFPEDRRLKTWRFDLQPGLEGRPWVREQLSRTMALLVGIVSVLLALTCANLTGLVLSRAAGLRGEVATRLALGASRWRVARLLLAEGAWLCGLSAAVAVGVAVLANRALQGTVLLQGLPPVGPIALDWRVLAFAIVVSTSLALLAGGWPAFRISRTDLRTSMAELGRTHTSDRRFGQRVLASAQVACSVTLLVGAALLMRSMAARLAIDPGFDPSAVLSFSVDPGLQRYDETRSRGFYRQLLDALRQTPGVGAAGLAWLRLYGQGAADTAFTAEAAPDRVVEAMTNMVSPGFFAALGLPILAGRDFTDAEFLRADTDGGGVVILTASLARRVFGAGTAVGQTITMANPEGRRRTVVGVVADTRLRRLAQDEADMVFEPFGQTFHSGGGSVVVGLRAPVADVAEAIRRTVAGVDPALPAYDVVRLDQAMAEQFANDRLVATLGAVIAAAATLLSAIGLYGVLARSVGLRRREIGMRCALGASPASIARLVMSEAGRMLATGLAAGALLVWWLARYVESRLFGVARWDPISFVVAVALVVAVAALATWPAARRAAGYRPADVLRT